MKLFLIPVFGLLFSCANQIKTDDNFYFPVKDFFTEKTYLFINQNDTSDKSSWKMKSYLFNNDTVLETTIFQNNIMTDHTTEIVSNGNATMQSYTLYDYTQHGNQVKTVSEILDSSIYKTSQKTSESIQWKIKFKDYRTQVNGGLTKVRILTSTDQNKQIFSDEYKFEMRPNEGYTYTSVAIYEKGKGLVSYKLSTPDGKEKNYVLVSVE